MAACVDDIVIYSSRWEAHLHHITVVVQALENAGLTTNLDKCCLGQREVTYLGYTYPSDIPWVHSEV